MARWTVASACALLVAAPAATSAQTAPAGAPAPPPPAPLVQPSDAPGTTPPPLPATPSPRETAPAAPAPAPYGTWSSSDPYPPPGAPPPGMPPPATQGAEYGRRPVELSPALALAFPHCEAGNVSDDRCRGVYGGAGIGFSALWRVSPFFAWGAGFELAGFGYDPPARLALRDASAGAVWLGLLARVYFVDEGSFDPYAELGLGGGFLGTTGKELDDNTYEHVGAGASVRLGGGFDFYLSRALRLGPTISVTRVFVDKITRCRAGGNEGCVDVSKDDQGHLGTFLLLGARLTINLGDEM